MQRASTGTWLPYAPFFRFKLSKHSATVSLRYCHSCSFYPIAPYGFHFNGSRVVGTVPDFSAVTSQHSFLGTSVSRKQKEATENPYESHRFISNLGHLIASPKLWLIRVGRDRQISNLSAVKLLDRRPLFFLTKHQECISLWIDPVMIWYLRW